MSVTAAESHHTRVMRKLGIHSTAGLVRYAHCAALLVRRGRRVARGDAIALLGSTGVASGPHVHR